ncbi:MAG: hypothetical protein ING44_03815 [Telmatospirillum sp.]|nr:hypothetical protein [Telmatospirillum sp.]
MPTIRTLSPRRAFLSAAAAAAALAAAIASGAQTVSTEWQGQELTPA